MIGFVYILEDERGRYYIGSTTDIKRRLRQHGYGHTKTTSRMKNQRVVLAQKYPTLKEARDIERKIKGLKRKDYISRMISDGSIKMMPS